MDAEQLDAVDLTALIPRPGRQGIPVTAEFVRELTPADLAMPVTQVQSSKPIKAIRDSHHAVARLLATGAREADIAAVTGYSASRISVLKADPQFQDLVIFYSETATEVVADFRSRMAMVGIDALQELHNRILDDEDGTKVSAGLLKDVVVSLADRTGHAPQRGPTAVTQINVTLTERMAKARERINGLVDSQRPTIDG